MHLFYIEKLKKSNHIPRINDAPCFISSNGFPVFIHKLYFWPFLHYTVDRVANFYICNNKLVQSVGPEPPLI